MNFVNVSPDEYSVDLRDDALYQSKLSKAILSVVDYLAPFIKNKCVCWWCCHVPESKFPGHTIVKGKACPVPFPVAYDSRKNQWEFDGFFCCLSCLLSYGWQVNPSKITLIRLFAKQFAGVSLAEDVPMALPRQMLRMFGGDKTIEEYRANTKHVALIPGRIVVGTRSDIRPVDVSRPLVKHPDVNTGPPRNIKPVKQPVKTRSRKVSRAEFLNRKLKEDAMLTNDNIFKHQKKT